jgi:hypothetical protein
MAWTRITDPDRVADSLPAWFCSRMIGLRGKFGFLLTTGDILRVTSIIALHEGPGGVVLLDVLLDHAGVPDEVDTAWRSKHYLGTPVPGASMATVNLGQVVTALEFVAVEMAEPAGDVAILTNADVEPQTDSVELSLRPAAAAD